MERLELQARALKNVKKVAKYWKGCQLVTLEKPVAGLPPHSLKALGDFVERGLNELLYSDLLNKEQRRNVDFIKEQIRNILASSTR